MQQNALAARALHQTTLGGGGGLQRFPDHLSGGEGLGPPPKNFSHRCQPIRTRASAVHVSPNSSWPRRSKVMPRRGLEV